MGDGEEKVGRHVWAGPRLMFVFFFFLVAFFFFWGLRSVMPTSSIVANITTTGDALP